MISMKVIFTKREERGKRNNALREKGFIPVVCYGVGKETGHFSVSKKELSKFLKLGEVVLEGDGELSGQTVMLQEIDKNPVSGEVRHIDFLFVDKSHAVEHNVSLEFVGDAPVAKKGGFIDHVLNSINIKALPQDIPSKIEVDLSGLEEIGQHIKVSDLPKIKNVEILTPKDEILVSVIEQVEEAEPEETAEEVDFSKIETTSNKGVKEEEEEGESEEKK